MWPDDRDLPVEIEAAFGADLTADPGAWSWTDLTSRLLGRPIRLRAGRSSGAGQMAPGTCTVELDNDDGALTPLHPMSPYWPNVELNTPLRVRLRRAEDAFGRTTSNGWGTSDSGQVWAAGGGTPSDFGVSAGVARHSHSTVNALRITLLPVDLVDVEQLVDASTSVLLTGAALVTGCVARYQDAFNYYWLRCEMNAGGTSIQLKITRMLAGVETQLANANPLPGITYAANTPMRVRASVVGNRLALKVWRAVDLEPAGWQVTAVDDDLPTAGRAGIQDWVVGGNTNTPPVVASYANYQLRVDRLDGNVDQWEPTFRPSTSGMTSTVRVTVSGVTRRLGQGTSPPRSPLHRAIAQTGPLAYWPLEDGVDSTQAASGLSGGTPMTVARDVMDFIDAGPVGSAGAAQPQVEADNSLSGVITGASSTAWQMSCWARGVEEDPLAPVPYFIPLEVRTSTGKILRLGMQMTADTFVIMQYDSESQTAWTNMVSMTFTNFGFQWSINTGWHLMQATFEQVGADTICEFWVNGVFASGATFVGITIGAPVSASAIGRFGGVAGDISRNMREVNVAHIAVHNDWPLVPGLYLAGLGHAGETTRARVVRVCAEDQVAITVAGTAGGELLGPQPIGSLPAILLDAEAADMGMLSEAEWGLRYLPREERYNAGVALTVDMATYLTADRDPTSVLRPTYDDQGIRNEWDVSRRDGSSATVVDLVHQARRSRYDDSTTINIASDARLADHAGWRVHLGTVVDLRDTGIPLDLAANPDLVDGWLSCGIGSRIRRTNMPAQYPTGTVDRLVEGWTETLGPRSWQVVVVPSPAEPWDVATVDGEPRVAADGSTLGTGGLTAGGTTFLLTSTASNRPWRTFASDPTAFPMDARVGGEQVTLSGITGATATISARGVNGITRAWPAGTVVDVWYPPIVAL